MTARAALVAALVFMLLATGVSALEFTDIYAIFGADADTNASNTGLYIFPTLVIPAGGEFEGMGQAYTAVARDASFFDANPAGSATLAFTELTFVSNNWIADSRVEGVQYSRRLGDIGLNDLGVAIGGKFLFVPFAEYDATGRQGASGGYSEGTIGINGSYNFDFGRSYEFQGLSVGATIKSAYRYVPQQIAPDQSALGVAADVGVLTRFNFLKPYSSRSPNFGVGIAARNFGPPVRGEPLPSLLSGGIAYLPLPAITIAADALLPLSFVASSPAPSFGGAFGLAVRVSRFFTAQTGFRYLPGAPRFTMGANLDLTDVSIDVNYTLDLITDPEDLLNRFSIQARLNFGDEGRGALRDLVDNYYLEAWRASALGEFAQAVELTEKALALNPEFTPARELRDLSLETLQLQADLRAIDLESIGDALENQTQDQ